MVLNVPGAEADVSHLADQPAASRRAQTREDLRSLADEQAALRRVAELVAAGASQPSIFDAVAHEACHLLGGHFTALLRYEPDGAAAIVAMWGAEAVRHVMHVGMRLSEDGDGMVQRVQRSARAQRIDSYEGVPGSNANTARALGLTSGVGAPIITEGRVWGAITVLGSGPSLPGSAEGRLEMFAKLVATAIANAQARADLQSLADEQTALRRIAELTAQEAPTDAVLEAVAVQASRLAGVEFGMVLRFVAPDGSSEIVALDGAPASFEVGMRAPGSGDGAVHRVWRTGRATRIDDLGAMSGQWPRMASRFGFSTSAGVPILLQGALWGALIVAGREPMPPAIESHLAHFAELVSTAISAAQARAELRVLADEQAALRRVAEHVARGAALDEVFAAVATEASKLLGDLAAALLRYDPGDLAVAVAVCNSPAPLGLRIPLAELALELDGEAGVAVPVLVEGRVWGALTTSTPGLPLPPGTEQRLAQFAELAGAAIANAENKAKLTASRARVVATADETRRRLQRDVHDSAQQRLVHTIITLKLARDAIAAGDPAGELVAEALTNAERANAELRDVVRGILPAALTRGGLRTGLESLVADLAVPVDLRVTAPRLSTHLETTAYFIVAEALANVVKHARATRAGVAGGDRGRDAVDPRSR